MAGWKRVKNRAGGMPALFQPRRDFFTGPDVLDCLPFARDGGVLAAHQNLGGERTRIVIGRHHKPVSAGAQKRKVIAFADLRQWTVLAKKIARFANRPDNVGLEQRTVPHGWTPSGTISW